MNKLRNSANYNKETKKFRQSTKKSANYNKETKEFQQWQRADNYNKETLNY